jgi:hypothetical protein
MVSMDAVDKVNIELRQLHDELVRTKENPHVIRLCKLLLQLTDAGNMDAQAEAQAESDLATAAAAEAPPEKKGCPPHVNIDPFGKCRDCGSHFGSDGIRLEEVDAEGRPYSDRSGQLEGA